MARLAVILKNRQYVVVESRFVGWLEDWGGVDGKQSNKEHRQCQD